MLAAFAVVAVSCISLGGIALVAMPHRVSDAPAAIPHRASDAPATVAPRASAATAAATAAALPAVPPAPALAAPAPDAVSAGETAELMARADQLIATGDIAAARGFYERAAEQGNAPAMTSVGKTYDPLFLEEMRVRGSRGNAGKAAEWYRRADAAGDAAAAERLKRLIARYAG
jgi:TPR repeat protein